MRVERMVNKGMMIHIFNDYKANGAHIIFWPIVGKSSVTIFRQSEDKFPKACFLSATSAPKFNCKFMVQMV